MLLNSDICEVEEIQLSPGDIVDLTSTNYPDPYPDILHCQVEISATNGGIPWIRILDFHLESDYDYLHIVDDDSINDSNSSSNETGDFSQFDESYDDPQGGGSHPPFPPFSYGDYGSLPGGNGVELMDANNRSVSLTGSTVYEEIGVSMEQSVLYMLFTTDQSVGRLGFHIQLEWRNLTGRCFICREGPPSPHTTNL